jgi:hypothetical protein
MALESMAPASCASCGLHQCHHNVEKVLSHVVLDGEAWLLDEKWEEFNAYLLSLTSNPKVFLPWKSRFLRQANYTWRLPHCAQTSAVPRLTLQRSMAMRSLKLQGGRRQNVLEDFDRRFAKAYSSKLPYTVNRLIVWQNFLPFLYMDKTLGGREYDVLLWRAPRHVLHEKLAEAQANYPESRTLGDFRSSVDIVEAERVALQSARRIITPHRELAELYPDKTHLLDWNWPVRQASTGKGTKIGFLGPTIGRRGAYVLREAMRKLDFPFVVIGKNLEDENFWNGMKIDPRPFGPQWLDEIGLLLAPAITEYKPRLLMQALQRGVTVIATKACGLPAMENLHFVDAHDADSLAAKIESLRPTCLKT